MRNQDTVSTLPEGSSMRIHPASFGLSEVSAHPLQQQLERQRLPRHILVVEDDPSLASLESEMLQARGYDVVTVESGERAIALLQRLVPDLVVLDLELSGVVDGWEVFKALRSFISDPIPVLITSSSALAVRKRIRGYGESRSTLDHLPKPYALPALLKHVQRMLMEASQ